MEQTAKLLADEAVIMYDIFWKRELAEEATKEHRDLFYLGVDGWKNNKVRKRMEKSACRYGGAEMLCRFYRRECRFQYSIVKEFLEKKCATAFLLYQIDFSIENSRTSTRRLKRRRIYANITLQRPLENRRTYFVIWLLKRTTQPLWWSLVWPLVLQPTI